MNWQSVPLPERIAALPTWGGMPIPYSAFRKPDGSPDFRVVEGTRNLRIATLRLCAICGQLLGARFAFIGGPISIEQSHAFFDGPMHRDCTEYAVLVCPYLAMVRSYSLRPLPEEADVSPEAKPIPPDRMAFGIARHYRLARTDAGTLLYLVEQPWEEVVWFRQPHVEVVT